MNTVYIATSLDGYIADRDGRIEWLNDVPADPEDDMGWSSFMDVTDAIVMGRTSFETVLGFDVDWPYSKPVFVLSATLSSVPDGYEDKVELLSGTPAEIAKTLADRGYTRLYIDGGRVIQGFLSAGLIDRMILTRLPILLGGGVPLFADISAPMQFEHKGTRTHAGGLVQSTYDRVHT